MKEGEEKERKRGKGQAWKTKYWLKKTTSILKIMHIHLISR